MEKKILLAVDGSKHSRNATIYTVLMAEKINHLHVRLFHVEPIISQFILDDAKRDLKARINLEKIREKQHSEGLSLLETYRAEMVEMGFDPSRIEISSEARKLGVSKDILNFAQDHQFDAIVVARRGISQLQEMIMGSVTADLVKRSRVIPIWIVDGKVRTEKLLMAFDGSEHCLRAVDHLSFIIGDSSKAELTLYHVSGKGRDYAGLVFDEAQSTRKEKLLSRANKKFMDGYHERCTLMLEKAGITPDRVRMQITEKNSTPGKMILEKVEKERFGTIVLGRSGESKSFFIGSVSKHVISNADNFAVWLVP